MVNFKRTTRYQYNALFRINEERSPSFLRTKKAVESGNPIDRLYFCDSAAYFEAEKSSSLKNLMESIKYRGLKTEEEKMERNREIDALVSNSDYTNLYDYMVGHQPKG